MKFLSPAVFAATILAAPGLAHAQAVGSQVTPGVEGGFAVQQDAVPDSFFTRDRNVSVTQRPRPDYQARGLPLGGFRLYPRLSLDVEGNDNVYAAADEQGDAIFRVRPELAMQSGWSRHQLGLYASADLTRFAEYTTEDTTSYTVSGNGRLDIVRGTNVFAGIDFRRVFEPRTSPTSPVAAAEPVEYHLLTGNVGAVREFNRVRVSVRADYLRYDFDDVEDVSGGVIDQDNRDRQVYSGAVRAEYALSPAASVFVSGKVNERDYKYPPLAGAVRRDSKGYSGTAGINFELTNLIRGEVEVGYLSQNYTQSGLHTLNGLAMAGKLEWFVSQLTTLTFNASRTVEDATDSRAGGFLSTGGSASVDHELLRNLILNAQFAYAVDDYQDILRKDKRLQASAGATFLFNRGLSARLRYSYIKQNSDGADSTVDFDVNRVLLTLMFQI